MLHAKDPSSTYCRRCGTELIWEHPKGSGHCQTSSDYVGGDICRSCLDELRANSAGTADSMTDDATLVPITLFQAPLAVLRERGLLEMYERNRPYTGPVPSQYYMPIFHGNLEYPGTMPQEHDIRKTNLLEYLLDLYNRDDRPNPKTSRSMSVGDVVKLDGQFYLYTHLGFTQVDFRTAELNGPVAKLVTPDGSTLQVSVFPSDDYPCINIDLLQNDGGSERICFVEHNPEKDPGQQLYIGVYCSTEEDTVYYGSYIKNKEETEEQ